jgi:hypothetical protein
MFSASLGLAPKHMTVHVPSTDRHNRVLLTFTAQQQIKGLSPPQHIFWEASTRKKQKHAKILKFKNVIKKPKHSTNPSQNSDKREVTQRLAQWLSKLTPQLLTGVRVSHGVSEANLAIRNQSQGPCSPQSVSLRLSLFCPKLLLFLGLLELGFAHLSKKKKVEGLRDNIYPPPQPLGSLWNSWWSVWKGF